MNIVACCKLPQVSRFISNILSRVLVGANPRDYKPGMLGWHLHYLLLKNYSPFEGLAYGFGFGVDVEFDSCGLRTGAAAAALHGGVRFSSIRSGGAVFWNSVTTLRAISPLHMDSKILSSSV